MIPSDPAVPVVEPTAGTHEIFDGADWYRALTLTERAQLLRAGRLPKAHLPEAMQGARAIIERWKRQPPFDRDDRFATRLHADGLDGASLLAILATGPEDL